LDTGRLFQETYDVFHKTVKKYKHQNLLSETTAVENVNSKGPNSFYESVENRKNVVPFVVPLRKALKEMQFGLQV
jgi:phosphoadenosine phosphosulfate reductase